MTLTYMYTKNTTILIWMVAFFRSYLNDIAHKGSISFSGALLRLIFYLLLILLIVVAALDIASPTPAIRLLAAVYGDAKGAA